eukprot:7116251-Alexandrium_andersonii.AAC.1
MAYGLRPCAAAWEKHAICAHAYRAKPNPARKGACSAPAQGPPAPGRGGGTGAYSPASTVCLKRSAIHFLYQSCKQGIMVVDVNTLETQWPQASLS